jgi:hypothetical protein
MLEGFRRVTAPAPPRRRANGRQDLRPVCVVHAGLQPHARATSAGIERRPRCGKVDSMKWLASIVAS